MSARKPAHLARQRAGSVRPTTIPLNAASLGGRLGLSCAVCLLRWPRLTLASLGVNLDASHAVPLDDWLWRWDARFSLIRSARVSGSRLARPSSR